MAEIKAYLTLIGDDFDLDGVSLSCGIHPTYTRHKNEKLGNGKRFGHTEWGIETDLLVTDDIENVLSELTSKITCSPQTLYEMAQKYSAEWHVLVLLRIFSGEMPVLFFSAEFIQLAAQLHAKIGFDTYVIND